MAKKQRSMKAMRTPPSMKVSRKSQIPLVSRLKAQRVLKKTSTRAFSPRTESKIIRATAPFSMVAEKPFTTQQVGINSTAIYGFSYDRKRLLLRITFWKTKQKDNKITYIGAGNAYWFYKVPEEIFDGFQKASSKGRFFYYMIRTKYKFTRIK